MLPFSALTGIYVFNILGSWSVINDEYLYTDFYYYSLLSIIIAFYLFYIVIFATGRTLYIDWTSLNHTPADRQIIVPFLVLLWGFSFFMFFSFIMKVSWNEGKEAFNFLTKDIGRALFDRYVFPFELISLVIVVSIIGAVMLAMLSKGDK